MRTRSSGTALTVLAPLCLLLVILLAWWGLTATAGIEAWRLPSPRAVAARALTLLTTASMWWRIGVTMGEALLGSALGALVAIPLAWTFHRSRLVRAAVEPILGATQALPAIALAPLLVLWVGYGTWAIAVLCALIVFFPILVSSVLGLRHLPAEVMEAAALDGASGWVLALRMELPLAAPAILAGVRNGLTLSVTGAIVGEMVMGGDGLGQVLVQSRNALDTAGMFVVIGVLCLMASLLWLTVRSVEHRLRP